MSGLKCSQIQLNQLATLLLETQRQKDRIGQTIGALQQQIEQVQTHIQSMQIADREMTARLNEYRQRLEQECTTLKERAAHVKREPLPESIQQTTTNQLQNIGTRLAQWQQGNIATQQFLRDLQSQLLRLHEADQTLTALEIQRQQAQQTVQMHAPLLQKWLPQEYQALSTAYKDFDVRITQAKTSQTPARLAALFPEFERNLQEMAETTAAHIAEANRREELHQRRLYILKGLREVCASLGFEEVTSPSYQEPSDSNTPITQTFDTVNEGEVTFMLHLESRIESDSGIRLDVCADEFGRLSDLLMTEYGVQTAFRRVDAETPPDRHTSTAKPAPDVGSQRKQQQAAR